MVPVGGSRLPLHSFLGCESLASLLPTDFPRGRPTLLQVIRRMPRRIFVPLPDVTQRERILQARLPGAAVSA